MSIRLFILLLAVVCFLLKGFNVNTRRPFDFFALGWALVVLAFIVP